MKKLLTSLLALGAGFASAQTFVPVEKDVNLNAIQNTSSSNKITAGLPDTVFTYVNRSTGYSVYTWSGGNGYIFGTNSAGTAGTIADAFGVGYDAPCTNCKVTELATWIAYKEIMGGIADSIEFKVYDKDAAGFPTTLRSFKKMSMLDVDSSLSVNFETFNGLTVTPFSIWAGGTIPPTGFFVCVDISGINDTIAIVDNAAGNGAGQKRIRMMRGTAWGGSAGEWVIIDSLLASGTIDVDLMMIPVVDTIGGSTGVTEFFAGNATFSPMYPNPTNGMASLNLDITSGTNVSVQIWDLTGKVLVEMPATYLEAGQHIVGFDLSNLSSGKYFYTVTTDSGKVTSRIVVTK